MDGMSTMSSCYRDRDSALVPAPNGSRAVSLFFRLCTIFLAFAAAIFMATATSSSGGSCSYTRFPAFVYLVACNIAAAILQAAAAILQAAAVYLHLHLSTPTRDEEDDEGHEEDRPRLIDVPAVVLVVLDVLLQLLLYSSMAAAYAPWAEAHGARVAGCSGRFALQVVRAKVLSLAAAAAVALAVLAKDLPLPFNVPPVMA